MRSRAAHGMISPLLEFCLRQLTQISIETRPLRRVFYWAQFACSQDSLREDLDADLPDSAAHEKNTGSPRTLTSPSASGRRET